MAKPKVPKTIADGANPIQNEAASTPLSAQEANGGATNGGASKKSAGRRSAKRLEISASEVRTNLVPINIEDEIRQLAYLLSERRGFVPGHETDDWLTAEREVRERYHQHSA